MVLSSNRKIIHIDMDAFFASVEQRDNPKLSGKPIAVGGGGPRGVVAAASYEARKFGVFSAMPGSTAKHKCPHLIFVKPRFDAYKATSLVIHSIFKRYTDTIEPLSLDEAYLDVTKPKVTHLLTGEIVSSATQIAIEIKQRIKEQTKLTASAGISINKFLAKIASDMDKPDGLYVIKPHQAEAFIASLPIDKFYGVGKVTATNMKAKGIFTGADLKIHSEKDLVKWFGKAGHYFYGIARGIDNRPVSSNALRKSVSVESTFDLDISSHPILKDKLNQLAEKLSKRLKKSKMEGKTVTLKIKFADFTQITRSKTESMPPLTPLEITTTSNLLLNKIVPLKKPVRLLGISVSGASKVKQIETNQLKLHL